MGADGIPVLLQENVDALPAMPRPVRLLVSLRRSQGGKKSGSLVAVVRQDNIIEFLHIANDNASLYSRCYVGPPENEICSATAVSQDALLYGCLDGSMGIARLGHVLPTRLHSLNGGAVFGMCSSADADGAVGAGRLTVALACQDGRLRLCSLANDTLTLLKTSDRHDAPLYCCTFFASASAERMVAAGTSRGVVRLYAADTLGCVRQHKVPGASHDVRITCIGSLPSWIVAGDSLGQVTIWPADMLNVNATCFKSHLADILCVASYSRPAETILACGVDYRMVQFVYSAADRRWSKNVSRRICTHSVCAMVLTADGRHLVSGSADGVLKTSLLARLSERAMDRLHSAMPRDVKPGGAFVERGLLHLLTESTDVWARLSLDDPLVVDFAVAGSLALVATASSLKMFALGQHRVARIESLGGRIFSHVAAVRDGLAVALAADGELWCFELAAAAVARRRLCSLALDGSFATSFAAKEGCVAVGLACCRILLASAELVHSIDAPAVPLCLFMDEQYLIAVLEDHSVAVFDLAAETLCSHRRLSDEMRGRHVRGILRFPEPGVYLIYTESCCFSMRIVGGLLRFAAVKHFPKHALLLALAGRAGDAVLHVLTRPWDHVLQQLPPALDVPKYGFK